MNRREFLKDGMTPVVVGAGCLKFGLKDALAQAKQAGKPLFSVQRLNALVPSKPNATYIGRAKEAEHDPLDFARKYFHVTSKQEESLASLSPDDIEIIRKAIRTALEKNYRLRVTFKRIRPGVAQPRRGMRLVAVGHSGAKISVEYQCGGGGTISTGEGGFQGECEVTIKGEIDVC